MRCAFFMKKYQKGDASLILLYYSALRRVTFYLAKGGPAACEVSPPVMRKVTGGCVRLGGYTVIRSIDSIPAITA